MEQFAICPHCHQRMLVRYGVRLSPLLADLFDMIERSGNRGILPDVLLGVFYPGKSTEAARRCLYQNIFHLNTRLAETDIEVRARAHGLVYRVQRRSGVRRAA